MKSGLEKQRKTKPIRNWIIEERPREMLIKQGAENINPAKLLAIILRTGSEGVSAEDLARRLLNHFGSLRAIDSAQIADLQAIEGIGMAKAAELKAAFELGKRLMREEAEKKTKIRSVTDVVEYVCDYYAPYLRDKEKEFFNIILLDGRNKVIDNIELSKGSVSASVVDVKAILKEATTKSASAIIMVHNHPSGEPEPSNEDIAITKRVVDACNLMDIKVLDHIVIGKNKADYVSLMDRGLIQGV
jgi:DNA repair protein RadC